MVDKHLIDRVTRALHEAMRHSPVFYVPGRPWSLLDPDYQSEYRAVTHSALVAAGSEEVWVVTDESNCSEDEQEFSSVIVVADSREAALAHLAENYGGAEDCVWEDQGGTGWWFTTNYGEYPWTMQKHTIERGGGKPAALVQTGKVG